MKRLTILLISTIIFMPRCSKMDIDAVKQMDEVAVALIGVNKYINMGDFSGMGTIIQRIAHDEEFDLHPIAKKIHKKTFGEYRSMLPFKLMAEREVISNEKYINLQLFDDPNVDEGAKKGVITPEGYKGYNPLALKKKHTAKLIDAMPATSDGVMLMYVEYHLEKKKIPFVAESRFSKASVKARVIMEVFDKEGEKIMKVAKTGESEEQVKVVIGVMPEVQKIKSMCHNATENAMDKVDEFISDKLSS